MITLCSFHVNKVYKNKQKKELSLLVENWTCELNLEMLLNWLFFNPLMTGLFHNLFWLGGGGHIVLADHYDRLDQKFWQNSFSWYWLV